ncbi:phage/plasmid primase, P4 family [Streptomyces mirabilis]|uniref:Phage/plasmid primase, P4 family n=1 Tax=Streptomyces mirabilis TaxID=68239 RepID=A0ABU3V558_9ACTN|nr:phage/plasmid primase, P4 family [Streptomyces mirabilis]MCX5355662.1 phage/plasmid primase, P4 family [Streptomyces mirabilis]MDU9001308.1 phage/plasmid primase, P4 family [Streptomyces mirabilis]
MTSPRNETLFDFDAAAVAAQIRSQGPVPLPAQGDGDRAVAAVGATTDGLLPDTLSDRGNAKLFVRLYADDYRHVPGIGWYRWDTTRWQIDEDDTVLWAAGDLAENIATHDPRGLFTSQALQQHRRRALSTTGINAMLTQAKSAPGMVLNAALLDADPYALCTPDGIVDLRTGLVKTPDPNKDFHSRSTSVGLEHVATPRWHRFLFDTFGEDGEGSEMIGYLQLLLGYSITGDVGGQVLPFLFGSGKNGKSVLLDVLMKLLGDYADAAPPGFLMSRPYEGHPTDLAELHGRRVIVCSEVKPGDRFDEARVKLLTGGDRIKARRMRQDFFSFQPTHKLWLLGNHRPEVGTGGFAFWRRMRLIPFERVVSDDRKIDNLADILVTEEGSGILGWLIEGARRYLVGDRDLTGPQRVRIATTAYAETEDHTGRFFEECCSLAPGLRTEQAGLYAVYRSWCQNEGAPALSSRAFAARARELAGLASPKEMILSNQRKYYPGIGLLTDEGREASA